MIVDDIITGISIKLNELFNGKYAIYFDTVNQGLLTPCFIIRKISSEVKQLLKGRKVFYNYFCISFVSSSSNDFSRDIIDTEELLLANMEFIESKTGERYFGTGINTEVVDGVLHFFINYNCTVREIIKNEHMQELKKHFIGR